MERSMFKMPLFNLATLVLGLPRMAKRLVALSVDLSLCVLTVWLAYYLRLGEFISFMGQSEWAQGGYKAAVVSIVIAVPIFIVSGLYRAIFRYSGWAALFAVARAVGIYGLIYAAIFSAIGITWVPRTVGIIQPILLLLFVGGSRAFARFWLGDQYQTILKHASSPKALIYGAGRTGRQLAAAMANGHGIRVIGFLDDDDRLHGHVLDGLPIYNPEDLAGLVSTLLIGEVLLAMPGISRKRRNLILTQIRTARVLVRTLPGTGELAQGKVNASDLRELEIDDLLGREAITPNHILLAMNTRSKIVVVTGAGGAIGSELCRQVLASGPTKLLLVEQSELALYAIHKELEERFADRATVLVPLLASVQDDDRMREIMSTWHPDTVYHAAAYKHVPLVEHNPAEGIKNNVLGTLRTAKVAVENGVSDFILISTDKALRPGNIMGASKRLAEMTLQSLTATHPATRFSVVRFGNVLGSSNSVVRGFRQQMRDGGSITLSHPDISRHFMTITEAAQLIVQAGAMAKGGDVFVLDMGRSVKLKELARGVIELSGLSVRSEQNVEGDVEIVINGLRSGEKIYEEPLLGNHPQPTTHPRITRTEEEFIAWDDLENKLRSLEIALNVNDVGVIRLMMQQLVVDYNPSDDIIDWVYLEQEAEAQALDAAG